MLLVSQLGTFIGFVVLARAQVLWVLFLARAIDGATAGNLTIAQAYIADNTTREQRTQSFALIGIAFGLGFLVGPGISGWLSTYSLSAPIYLAAAMSFTSILCTTFLLPKEKGTREAAHPKAAEDGDAGPAGRRISPFRIATYREYFSRPLLGGLLLQFLLYLLAFSTFTSGFALFAERRFRWHGVAFQTPQVAMVFIYVGFLGLIIQGGLIRRLVPKFGEPILVAAGFASMAAGYAGLGEALSIRSLVVVSTVSSFGNAVLRPALSALVTHAARKGEQGIVLGVTQSLGSMAQIVAPIVGTLLLDAGELAWWARVAALAAGGGLIAGHWGSQRMPKHAISPAKEA